jgi:predicted nucleotidyltransferase
MRTSDPAVVLFGRSRRLVLGWLFGHPDEKFYLRDIARQTGLPVGSIQGELEQLTAAGLLTRTREGRQVYFQANRASPVFPELSSLLTKTAGIAGVLREALAPLASRVQLALLYGSAARNELRQGSDVDLLVVGEVDFGEVVAAMRTAESRLGREVNPSIYPPDEFQKKLREGHHFLNAVMREPYVALVGNPDDFERLGTAQQVARGAPHVEERDRGDRRRRGPRPERQPRRRSQR